jgi:hypothetical protein
MGWASDLRHGPADDAIDRYEKALGSDGRAELRRRWSEWHSVKQELFSFYPALYTAATEIWCIAGFQFRNVQSQVRLSEYISDQAESLLELAPLPIVEQWETGVRSLFFIDEKADDTLVPYRSFSKYDFLELPVLNQLLPLYDSVSTFFILFWSDYIEEVDQLFLSPLERKRLGSFALSSGYSCIPSRPVPSCSIPTAKTFSNSIRPVQSRPAPVRKRVSTTPTATLNPKPARPV